MKSWKCFTVMGRTDGTDGTGRDGRTDGRTVNKSVLQFSSYFVGIQIKYISTYIRNKNCHQHSYGFQNFMSSWGWGSKFSNLKQVGDFSIFGSKSSHVQGVILKIGYFSFLIFGQAPTMSLRGPGKIYTRGPKGRVYGWMDGWMGWMEYQKCPSNFFILYGYIENVYTYLYIYTIIVTKILMGLKI